ncbi:MAG: MG2 domain-containing protein [Pseudomonadota bacterium]
MGSALLGKPAPRHVATAALVTNLAVHFKWGREGSAVWVTRLDSGKPVARAHVRISGYCGANNLWEGDTDSDGVARVAQSLGEPHGNSGCNDYSPQPLIVSARSGEDYSFTLSAWAQGIAPYDFQLPTGYEEASYLAHTVFDRSLFRAGETVSMKHFVRLKALHGLAVPPEDRRPRNVVIRHIGSGQQYVQPATFAADGTATSTWTIPRDARLGEYSVAVTRTLRTPNTDSADAREYPAGIFRVEQFRVPTMQAVLQPPAAPQVNATRVPLDLYVNYLSGGGAANQQVRLRSLIEPRSVRFADYPDTSFGGDEVREGLEDPNQGDEAFTDWAARFGAVRGESPASTVQAAVVQNLQLDANGAARASIADLPRSTQPRSLVAELEYQDANGERLTTATRIALWPAALAVGISADGWVGKPDALSANVVVVDLAGKPMPAQQVDVTLFQRASYAWRKRLVGGFYAYENKVEVRRLAGGCSGHSDAQGRLKCTLSPGVSGEVILRAASRDAAGNVAFATTSAWVVGEDETWFSPGNTDRMDLLPERKEYQPGETARFQVRMPFRSALALVTVEREGVIESFVRRLSGRNPVIDVPIRGGYAPNVFVSVLAVRGRAGSQAPTALVDLAKPAFRMGAAQIRVGWQDFRLEVGASTPQQIYKVRDVVPVDITVRRANGQPLPAGTEVALAAVDEGLLELAPNPSWQLLAAMMGERRLSVWTSTAQMQVVGKRHYGRKALPPGGGGGRAPARELFDTLLYWNPRVAIDPEGKARINVPLNDSLTAFRVVAIASAGAERFGTGETTLRSSQDLMLHSGLPQVLRERDQFTAVFTARNASPRDMRVVASAQVGNTQLAPQTFALAAGASRALSWPTVAPLGASTLAWTVQIREEAGAGSDALKVSQQVLPAAPVRTLQATLTQLDGALAMPVSRPQDALPGRGGLAVTLMPTLAGVAGGVRDYMLAYPYNCIEQQLSRAVAVNDRASWNTAVERLPLYLDRDGLLRYFPIDWLPGSDTLNSYILALAQESGWPLPDDSRQRMLDGLTAFVAGRVQRDSPLPTADLTLRKLAAIAALARHDAADTAMLGSFAIEPGLWPSSALLDWIDILHRVKNVPQQSTRLQAAQNALRSRLDFQGTRLAFANERADRLPWLMVSGDVIANRAILLLLTAPEWQEDMPRLLRASLGRQVRGHWDLTPANAWGTLALAKFAARFEATKVSGPTQLRLAAGAATPAVTIDNGKGTAQFAWPAGASQLELQHKGTGKPWVLVQSRAAVPLTRALSSGYSIKRSITAVEQLTPGAWSVGDVLRVRLTIDAQADSSWVVVEDPVPAGATILGSGLGGDSALLAGGWQDAGRARVAYQERRQDAYRAYYSYVPKGSFSLEYTLRLNSAGRFNLPPVHAEAMYAPEMLGDLPVAALDVRAAP